MDIEKEAREIPDFDRTAYALAHDDKELRADIADALRKAFSAGEESFQEAAAKAIPMNWCDSLLTGKGTPKGPLDNHDVEKLLRGVRDRIRSLPLSAPTKEARE